MVAERYELRLDAEHKQKLRDLAEKRGASAPQVLRSLIDEAHEEEVARAHRLAAVRRLSELAIEKMPDPEELSRQLEETYDPRLP
jgi:predicted DNA-binding protein